ncbi:uncharacterized protein LOC111080324 [Drosophila obscura]|uniref:uncharacterized protein LOC111080324 n=1 Tax=Drosophila obscura TaxID=7282 RepID=UPI001BB1EC79|nr:uncharacterized protein LOC111080324 [Drosophila obscura]
MCACCRGCYRGCCFPARCRELVVSTEPRICNPRKKAKCDCHRNRCLLVALAYLFRCTNLSMLSTLWRMADNRSQPLRGFTRDPAWRVMQSVKAPYTDLNDLEIYDSLYDRCGIAIDPLDPNNTYKMLRLMFLNADLESDQRKHLILMLEMLNELAFRRVNLDLLLQTLASINIGEFVSSLVHQDNLNSYNTKLSEDLSQLYERVVTTDKNAIIENRSRRAREDVDMDVDPVKTQSDQSRNTLMYCIPTSLDIGSEQSRSSPSGCLRYALKAKEKRQKNNSSEIMQSGRKGTNP